MTDWAKIPTIDLDSVRRHVRGWEQLSGERLLLTGGTGFIGKWLLASFLHANRTHNLGARIAVLSRDVGSFLARHPELDGTADIDWIEGDIRSFDLPAGMSCRYCIHAATDVAKTRHPADIFEDCIVGTRRVIDQSGRAGVSRLLLLSSGAVYGPAPEHVKMLNETFSGAPDTMDPRNAYGEGKRAAELLCVTAGAEAQIHVSVARCFAFVGPHLPLNKHFAIGNFIADAMAERTIEIQGDGTPLRSYMYAADLAEWLWVTLFRGRNRRAYNVGGDIAISIEELARLTATTLGSGSLVRVAKLAENGQPISRYLPDTSRARNELDLHQRIPLQEAIRRTADWAKRTMP